MKWYHRLFVPKRALWKTLETVEALAQALQSEEKARLDSMEGAHLANLEKVQREWDNCIRDRARMVGVIRRSLKLGPKRMRAELRRLVEDYD